MQWMINQAFETQSCTTITNFYNQAVSIIFNQHLLLSRHCLCTLPSFSVSVCLVFLPISQSESCSYIQSDSRYSNTRIHKKFWIKNYRSVRLENPSWSASWKFNIFCRQTCSNDIATHQNINLIFNVLLWFLKYIIALIKDKVPV